MHVPFIDLKQQYAGIKEQVLQVTSELFDSQMFILGPHVETLEKELAAYCGTQYAVGVSSGSDALLAALMAAGIQAGDRVLTTPFTFFATAGAIVRLGAWPVFVDIEAGTCNLDPQLLEATIQALPKAERRTLKAIIPVHLYGQCADMDPILEIAKRYELKVIEDAAQAIGAEYRGRRAGSLGDMACFSFFPTKNLGAFGDGGMITTSSAELYDRLRLLRVHGSRSRYYHQLVGANFRLDALQAAILLVKRPFLDQWIAQRQAHAARYTERLEAAGLTSRLTLPKVCEDRHVFHQFVIQVPGRRDDLRDFLEKAGVHTEVYYPLPLHLQPCFAALKQTSGAFPVAEQVARRCLALPVFPELTSAQQDWVITQIQAFFDLNLN